MIFWWCALILVSIARGGWRKGRVGWGVRWKNYSRTLWGTARRTQTAPAKRKHSNHGNSYSLVMPNRCAPQLPMCQSWFFRVINHPTRKANPLNLAIVDMVCGYLVCTCVSWAIQFWAGFCKDTHIYCTHIILCRHHFNCIMSCLLLQ